ncbi:MAG: hypothetical protein V4850_14455 [Myxococcota bacterium]
MKVLARLPAASVLHMPRPALSSQSRPTPFGSDPDASRFSQAGSMVSSLRQQAAAHGVNGDIRPGVVEDMRREIAEGRLGTPEDLDRAVNALLGQL